MKAHGAVGSAEHYTPPWLLDVVRATMGSINLDPCSCELANAAVQAEHFYDAEMDGLALPWFGRVFVNPPGGKLRLAGKFWKKLVQEYRAGTIDQACYLSFSLDSLQTTQRQTEGGVLAFPTWIPDRRFDYWTPEGEQQNAVRPSALTWLPPRDSSRGEWGFWADVVATAPMKGALVWPS